MRIPDDGFRGLCIIIIMISISLAYPLKSGAETPILGHVLLIGSSKYDHMSQKYWLEGPAHDVDLMYKLFTTEIFNFKPEQVTRLAENLPGGETQRPTRANIEREFRRLADVAAKGDYVVILLAGHGSQKPADNDPRDREPDGLDEIFLPADVKTWNDTLGQVENAITDDELREWLTAIRNTGAFVWIMIDACHSGTMTRGTLAERQLPPDLLIPSKILKTVPKVRDRADTPILGLSPTADDIVAMYAARSIEPTYERRLPDRFSGLKHGVFTYTVAEVLQQSESRITYRELIGRVNARYQGMDFGRWKPIPQLEGGGRDRFVLGEEAEGRPKMLIREADPKHPERFILAAGTLHGLKQGSLLAVYPPAGTKDADQLTGYVSITEITPFTSSVRPVKFEQVPAPQDVEQGSRCETVFVNYGDVQMKFVVQRQSEDSSEIRTYFPTGNPGIIAAALKKLESEKQFTNLVEQVADAEAADWVLRIINDRIRLIPASGLPANSDDSSRFDLGSIHQKPKTLANRLSTALPGIARANNLKRLAVSNNSFAGNLDLKIDVLRFENESDNEGSIVEFNSSIPRLHVGDIIGFRIQNTSVHTTDVTLLCIDSGYGIQALYPVPGRIGDNRWRAGQTMLPRKVRIVGNVVGMEHLVVIAVKATDEPLDFSCFAQPTLEQARNGEHGRRAMSSPLGKLLGAVMYGERTKSKRSELDEYAVYLYSWETVRAE